METSDSPCPICGEERKRDEALCVKCIQFVSNEAAVVVSPETTLPAAATSGATVDKSDIEERGDSFCIGCDPGLNLDSYSNHRLCEVCKSSVDNKSTTKRRLFDEYDKTTWDSISVQMIDKDIQEKVLEACERGSSMELALSQDQSSSLNFVVVDVTSQGYDTIPGVKDSTAPGQSNDHASTHQKVCQDCSCSIESWMIRCRKCYAKWARVVTPSQGPGKCRSCPGATTHEWQRYCNMCYSAQSSTQRDTEDEFSLKRQRRYSK